MVCHQFLTKEDVFHHICKIHEELELYLKIITCLARASTRRCPFCNYPGMKDLACNTNTLLDWVVTKIC